MRARGDAGVGPETYWPGGSVSPRSARATARALHDLGHAHEHRGHAPASRSAYLRDAPPDELRGVLFFFVWPQLGLQRASARDRRPRRAALARPVVDARGDRVPRRRHDVPPRSAGRFRYRPPPARRGPGQLQRTLVLRPRHCRWSPCRSHPASQAVGLTSSAAARAGRAERSAAAQDEAPPLIW